MPARILVASHTLLHYRLIHPPARAPHPLLLICSNPCSPMPTRTPASRCRDLHATSAQLPMPDERRRSLSLLFPDPTRRKTRAAFCLCHTQPAPPSSSLPHTHILCVALSLLSPAPPPHSHQTAQHATNTPPRRLSNASPDIESRDRDRGLQGECFGVGVSAHVALEEGPDAHSAHEDRGQNRHQLRSRSHMPRPVSTGTHRTRPRQKVGGVVAGQEIAWRKCETSIVILVLAWSLVCAPAAEIVQSIQKQKVYLPLQR